MTGDRPDPVLRWARAACTRLMVITGLAAVAYAAHTGTQEVIPARHTVTLAVLIAVFLVAWIVRPTRNETLR